MDESPLYYAIIQGSTEIVRALVTHANPSQEPAAGAATTNPTATTSASLQQLLEQESKHKQYATPFELAKSLRRSSEMVSQ